MTFFVFRSISSPLLANSCYSLTFLILYAKKWIALNLDGLWSLDGWNSAKVKAHNSKILSNCSRKLFVLTLYWKPWSWTTEFFGRTLGNRVNWTETILALERWMVGSNFQLNQDVKLLFADHFNSLRWLWQSNIWLWVTMRLRIKTVGAFMMAARFFWIKSLRMHNFILINFQTKCMRIFLLCLL